jgi:hypothetical protein
MNPDRGKLQPGERNLLTGLPTFSELEARLSSNISA